MKQGSAGYRVGGEDEGLPCLLETMAELEAEWLEGVTTSRRAFIPDEAGGDAS